MIENIINDSWSANYETQNIKLVQLEIIERFDEEEKAKQFIYDHIHHSSFREKAIVRLMEKEDYSEVIRLCGEGEKVDKEYRGLGRKWENISCRPSKDLVISINNRV